MDLAGVVGQGIRLIQLIFIPLSFFLSVGGMFYFIFALKNPTKKRKGYLMIIWGFTGLLFLTYAPLLFVAFGLDPQPSSGKETVSSIVDSFDPLPWQVYDVIKTLIQPIVFAAFYLGLGFYLLANKNPVTKRLGLSLMVSTPVLWVILQSAKNIYYFFVPS